MQDYNSNKRDLIIILALLRYTNSVTKGLVIAQKTCSVQDFSALSTRDRTINDNKEIFFWIRNLLQAEIQISINPSIKRSFQIIDEYRVTLESK